MPYEPEENETETDEEITGLTFWDILAGIVLCLIFAGLAFLFLDWIGLI